MTGIINNIVNIRKTNKTVIFFLLFFLAMLKEAISIFGNELLKTISTILKVFLICVSQRNKKVMLCKLLWFGAMTLCCVKCKNTFNQ